MCEQPRVVKKSQGDCTNLYTGSLLDIYTLKVALGSRIYMAKCLPTVIVSVLVLLAAGCGGDSAPTTPACVPAPTAKFAYALTGIRGVNISMFTVDSCTGTFAATTPASIATGPNQFGSEDMVADPLGRFVYVANLVSNVSSQSTISMYTINSATGVLTPTTPPTVSTGFFPQGIAIDPFGKFVYTANSDDNTVSMFTINAATGVLTPTTPAAVAAGLSPGDVTVDPSGKFVYAANGDDNTVSMYAINSSTGVLSPTTPATAFAGGIPFGVTVAPSGKFAYVTDNLLNRVVQFTIDPTTGVLHPNTPSAVTTGQGPTAVAVDPASKFAFAVNRLDNTVSMFAIDANTGNLTPHGTIAAGTQPFRIVFDPSGKFLYVVNEASATSIYTINGDGTLTNAGTTGTATGALSIAITSVAR